MSSATLSALCGSAFAIGVFHTLLGPDHYLPFVALSKARAWSRHRTLLVTAGFGLAHTLGTVLLGFAGVVMTLRPTIDQNQLFAGVVGLLSGMGAALAYLQVTALGKAGEPEERTVFYFSVGTTVVGSVGMLFTDITPWSAVRWQDAVWVIPIGWMYFSPIAGLLTRRD